MNKIHPSTYFYSFWLSLIIFVIFLIQTEQKLSFLLTILLFVILICLFFIKKLRFLTVIILALFVANLRVNKYIDHQQIYRKINQKQVQFCGRLINNSTYKYGSTTYRLDNLRLGKYQILGKIIVKQKAGQKLTRSNYICGQGKFELADGGYNGIITQAKINKINSKIDFFTKFRHFLSRRLAGLNSKNRDFANVILLGDRSLLDYKQQQKIRTVGLSHIVVVSGLHLMILVNFIRKSQLINSRKIEFWTAIILGLFFAIVTGFSASMVRACLMLFLGLVAWYYGRKFNPINLFILIMGISLLINPFYALFDVSWLLSYAAFWSVLVVAPAVKQYFGLTEINSFFDLILTVLMIQIFLAPLLIYLFGSISIVSILTNLLIVPIINLLMIGLILLIIIANFWLAKIVIWFLELIFNYIFTVIDFCVNIPLAKLDLTLNFKQTLIIYLILMLILVYLIYDNKMTKLNSSSIIESDEKTN